MILEKSTRNLFPLSRPLKVSLNPAALFLQTLRLADFMMKKTMGFSADSSAGSDSSPESWSPVAVTPPRPLDLALSPASLRAIASAEVAFDRLVNKHEASEMS